MVRIQDIAIPVLMAAIQVPVAAQEVARLPQRDQAMTGSLSQVFAVGREEGERHEVFSNVPSVTFDADGNLYIVDRDEGRVLVFTKDGRFLRQIARHGEGPGELRIPMAVAVTSDGRVAVFDMANRAVSLFDREGSYQSLARLDAQYGMIQAPIRAGARGGLLIAGSQVAMGGRGTPPAIRDSVPILLMTLGDDAQTRPIFSAPSPAPRLAVSGGENSREVRITQPPTFSPSVSWAPMPDGRLAVAFGTDWRVRIVGPNGTVTSILERPIRARSVSERDKEAARAARREALASGAGMVRIENVNGRERMSVGGSGLPADQIERMLQSMEFAAVVPVIRGIRTDAEGRIWVQREGGPGAVDHPIDIVSSAGVYLGTLRGEALPDAFGPGGLAAFITANDLGVQSVVVKRMPAGWRP